ncbi:MAG: hypothetical protein N4A33_12085 [Bacteriovoracaceae bacterium]|jgi:hypothetical protein|nr:hypothetical protein [Bacteriovoracaceae bacterium]
MFHLKSVLKLSVLLSVLVSCGNPVKIMKKEIKKSGHIMFANPIEDASIGTMIGGTPKRLSYITASDTCFNDDGFEGLKQSTSVDLPSIAKTIEVGGEVKFDMLSVLTNGTLSIKAGVGFDKVSSFAISFEDVSIEYFDLVMLARFYNHMDSECKSFLNEFGFVAQALKVGKMKFVFYDKVGGEIDLSLGGIADIIDLGIGVDFEVTNNYQLNVKTPKYIGYQVGRLLESDNGVSLYRASKVRGNKFIFEDISLFDR